MSEETRKRIAKLYRDGKWNPKGKDDLEAKKLADKYYPIEEEKPVEKVKKKRGK